MNRFALNPFYSIVALLVLLAHAEAFCSNPGETQQDSSVYIIRPRYFAEAGSRPEFIPYRKLQRPKIGLALSGGGARALSQIGVLQVFEENRIPVDVIVGTSMGSIVGGLYAVGYTPKELEDIAKTIEWAKLLQDRPPRQSLFFSRKQERDRLLLQIRMDGFRPYIPPALTPGQRLQSLLMEYTMQSQYAAYEEFDRFRIPFRVVCTDLRSGQKVLISEGDLAEAMHASLAFPLLFAPVPIDGKLLADGGLVDNIPTEDVRNFAVDIVIAVDATSEVSNNVELNTPWVIADQVTTIMQRDRNVQSRKNADILLRIADTLISNTDFSRIDSMIQIGRNVATQHLSEIRAALAKANRQKYDAIPRESFRINRVAYHPQRLNNRIANRLLMQNGERRLYAAEIIRCLEEIYRGGMYRDVYAKIIARNDGTADLHIIAIENPLLKHLEILGNSIIDADSLRKAFDSLIGKPLNQFAANDALENVLRQYRKLGYSMAKYSDVSLDTTTGTGLIRIDEGRIHKISIERNLKTKDHVIFREFPLQGGEIFNIKEAQRGIRNIYGTGLFDRVAFSMSQDGQGLDITIKVQEKKSVILSLSAGIDSERKTRGFAELSNENLFGLGARLRVSGLVGSRDQEILSNFNIERIFKTYLFFDASLYLNQRKNFIYEKNGRLPIGEYAERKWGGQVSIGQLMKRFGIVSAELISEHFDFERISGYGYPTGESVISRFALRSVVDTRNQLPYATKGRYIHVFYDMGIRTLKSDASFFRFFAMMETYHTIGKNHTFQPRIMIGTSDLTTPFAMQFRIGGPTHIFGLRDQEWIGREFLVANFGYRYRVPLKLPAKTYLGLRFDIGGVWDNPEKVNYGEIVKAFGSYISFETILGAIEFAYGRLETGQQRFYFSLGYKL